MVQSGIAANASVPFLFLGSGKNMKNYALPEENLPDNHGTTTKSKFRLDINGYMTYAYYIIATTQFCKGICALLVGLCFYFNYSI